ncbi:MAG: TetR/AcrR family transcriptional regulator [Thermomicrobiales bacterium]
MKAIAKRQRAQPTITEIARRAQIIEAAIATIAEIGYAKASFSQIAKTAGLSSTGLISYHFSSKQELNAAIVEEVIGTMSAFMHECMQVVSTSTPQGALVAYITGTIAFMQEKPAYMQALLGIFTHGGFVYEGEQEQAAISPLEGILRDGQDAGVFRSFDLRVMATTIQRSIDGIPMALAADPSLDLDVYARELVELFTLATQARCE